MLRTLCSCLAVSGITMIKKGALLAQSYEEEIVTSIKRYPLAIDKKWMAEPLTDEATREAKKDAIRTRMELIVMKIQSQLCRVLEDEEDPKYRFKVDRWTREEGGGGITCVLQDGKTFEKAGEKKCHFFACGISSVIHPKNPNVPTMHFNFRYFEVEEDKDRSRWWFGGGCDLTPYFLDEDDAKHFHRTLKSVCDSHNPKYYTKFKSWCDDYFRIKHRNIALGIGGIFFDDLDTPNQEDCFKFVGDCMNAVIPAYLPIVKKNRDAPYSYGDRQWQLIKRGHFVEFNLVYDRGTKFGLYTPGARHESILMSLPFEAKWEYRHSILEGSKEHTLTEVLRNPRQWV
ncbi:CPOX [Lepeophtheirus salmonis]|uniref:coproporphyrinogen oxidase n=1 Tax=Lepeophtheirus salmonis TaxID=72036 RepID=A0A7R8H5S8_LEPSM|nr:CPOX [Lepeophtheirus salmonis]CAF2868924.1 CPOX [Lepeophtheirus salmonis]